MTGDSTVQEARFHTSESKVRWNSVELFLEAPRSRDYQGTGTMTHGIGPKTKENRFCWVQLKAALCPFS